MKRRWIFILGLAVVGAFCVFLLLVSHNGPPAAVAETRRALRLQGFKTDLSEFNFSTSPELRARAGPLTNADLFDSSTRGADRARRARLPYDKPDLMVAVGANAAVVVWRQQKLPAHSGPTSPPLAQTQSEDDLWPALREILNEGRAALDTACEAALSGPIRFEPDASRGTAILQPHLPAVRVFNRILGTRAVLELRDGNKDAAWTNLLAATRLVTAWNPEPCEVSHLVRFDCVAVAYDATWQTLQAPGWADDRLAQLQHEWESVDYFRGLPETAAFDRAGAVDMCHQERRRRFDGPIWLKDLLRSPSWLVWSELADRWRRIRYLSYGTYEDEKALLLHYRDREVELQRAVESPTWSEMRQLPGVTNLVPFQSKHPSGMKSMINVEQQSLRKLGGGQGLLGRAAEAEARRRLLITAIALERYRGRHGSYAKALPDLVPELLPNPPLDFMDGKPLRYRLTDDGHFVLYSVGLDCVDDGGKMPRTGQRGARYQWPAEFGPPQATDLFWPRPASAAEVQAQQAEDEKQAGLAKAAAEEQAEGTAPPPR
jgi:hypothetical protein